MSEKYRPEELKGEMSEQERAARQQEIAVGLAELLDDDDTVEVVDDTVVIDIAQDDSELDEEALEQEARQELDLAA